ncbi:mannitol dehydrogenase family protein [Actinoplanes sp. NPDC051633]|uniref:mannitol dehydrogenase family protein n=1 Tax=Actinoplanes sp. NPDC051633 TaxID=3155670 RepID=UPI00342342F9
MPAEPLARTSRPPVRIAHLGLGNFFRAHQAWYTSVAPDADRWGIAAFTGRSAGLARSLEAQAGLYNLVVRGAERDDLTVIGSVAAAHAGGDLDAWTGYLSRADVALVTLTVTEAAYRRGRGGGLDDTDPDVRADLAAWRSGAGPTTIPGRMASGLNARRANFAGPLAVVSCDNLPGNGAATRQMVLDFAGEAEPALASWIRDNVSFVTTMVDRITPRTTPEDVEMVAERGAADASPVVTEPFTEWLLEGDFPRGRPAWEAGGARFVADVKPHELRKLLLLNGGHSLLAYAGSALGLTTIAEAVADERCRAWLNEWWDEAVRHVPLPADELADYRTALLGRFANPRIRHTLAQIASDGSQKIPIRVLPVLRGERAAGRMPGGAIRVLAAWIGHLRGRGAPVNDAGAAAYQEKAATPRDVLALLAPDLAADQALADELARATGAS